MGDPCKGFDIVLLIFIVSYYHMCNFNETNYMLIIIFGLNYMLIIIFGFYFLDIIYEQIPLLVTIEGTKLLFMFRFILLSYYKGWCTIMDSFKDTLDAI